MPGQWQDLGLADDWAALTLLSVDTFVLGDDGFQVWRASVIPMTTDSSRPTLTGAGTVVDGDGGWDPVIDWVADTAYGAGGDPRQPTTPNGHYYQAANDFTSGATEPDPWDTGGGITADGIAADDPPDIDVVELSFYFDVWSRDDYLGTALGELTQAYGRWYKAVDNAPGSGQLTINVHDEQYAWCGPKNLVRVRLEAGGPFDYDDTRYIGTFVLDEGDQTLLSDGEDGAEEATLGGMSAEVLMTGAVIDYVAHYVDDIVAHPYDQTALVDGQWHISEDISGAFTNAGSPGAMLRIFLRNAGAMSPEPIPYITHDWNVDDDSNGDPWEDGDGQWDFNVGTSLFDVLQAAVAGGLHYKMNAALLLSAWDNSQGSDLSGDIVFTEALDILGTVTRPIHASPVASRILVHGSTHAGAQVYHWAVDSGIEAEIGVVQGFLEYPYSPTTNRLEKAGQRELARRKNQHDGPPTIPVLASEGKVPFLDYFPGDTVGITIDGIFDAENARVSGIKLTERETGECDIELSFLDQAWDAVPGPNRGACDCGTAGC